MYKIQLFNGQETLPRDARLLREGSLTIGRDPAADWHVDDPSRTLSRIHCVFDSAPGGELGIVALGANGIVDETFGRRLALDERMVLSPPARLKLGDFTLVISRAQDAVPQAGFEGTVIGTAGMPDSFDVPTEWEEAATLVPAGPSSETPAALLEAFCAGAGLDASQLAREDPAEIMHRVGGLYRQMILGVGDLMKERDRARARHVLARTTISGANNNPFKWAPSQRLAIDLITGESEGFLAAPAALQACFRDLKRHIAATSAGFRASLREAVDSLSPARLARSTKRHSILQSRAAAAMAQLELQSADLAAQIDGESTGILEDAFTRAYLAIDADTSEAMR